MSRSNKLTTLQYVLTIAGAQVGIGILTLPRELAEGADSDGWISLIIGWLITIAISLIIVKIMERHPNHTIYDILKKYFGRWLGGGLTLVWILYSTFIVLVVMYTTIFVFQLWICKMSASTIALLLLFPVYLVARSKVAVIGRYAEFVFFFTLWMPLLLTIPAKDGKLIYLLPIIKEGWLPILLTVKNTLISFAGFELAFILYPFLKQKAAAAKGIIIANTIALITFLHITLMSYVTFSPDEIRHILWPTLNLLKPIQFTFIERVEVIFLSFYLFLISTTIIPYLFAGSIGIGGLVGLKDHKKPLIVLLALLLITVTLLPNTYEQLTQLQNCWLYLSLGLIGIFPFVLALYIGMYSIIRGRKSI